MQDHIRALSSVEVAYRGPEVTKNALFVLGSTWTQMTSHLEAVRDKQSGALRYQAVVAVTYNLQGQFKQVRHYKWADVEISTSSALQIVFIQDVKDIAASGDTLADCGGVCRQETITVPIDEGTLKGADHDLLVQVHAGRDSNNIPLYPAIAKFTPAYVAGFLRQSASKQAVATTKQ